MWGYLVLGVIIGMLMFFLFYCIRSFVDDCNTTSDMVERLLYRTDNLRKRVNCLESDLSVVASKALQKPQPTKEKSEYSVEDDM